MNGVVLRSSSSATVRSTCAAFRLSSRARRDSIEAIVIVLSLVRSLSAHAELHRRPAWHPRAAFWHRADHLAGREPIAQVAELIASLWIGEREIQPGIGDHLPGLVFCFPSHIRHDHLVADADPDRHRLAL